MSVYVQVANVSTDHSKIYWKTLWKSSNNTKVNKNAIKRSKEYPNILFRVVDFPVESGSTFYESKYASFTHDAVYYINGDLIDYLSKDDFDKQAKNGSWEEYMMGFFHYIVTLYGHPVINISHYRYNEILEEWASIANPSTTNPLVMEAYLQDKSAHIGNGINKVVYHYEDHDETTYWKDCKQVKCDSIDQDIRSISKHNAKMAERIMGEESYVIDSSGKRHFIDKNTAAAFRTNSLDNIYKLVMRLATDCEMVANYGNVSDEQKVKLLKVAENIRSAGSGVK